MEQSDIKLKRSELKVIYLGLLVSILTPVLMFLFIEKPRLDIESTRFDIETRSSRLTSEIAYAQSIFNFRPNFDAILLPELSNNNSENGGKTSLSLPFTIKNMGSQTIDVKVGRINVFTQHFGSMTVRLEENKDFTLELDQTNRGNSLELSPSSSIVLLVKINIDDSKIVNSKVRVIVEWEAKAGSSSLYVLEGIVSDNKALDIIRDFESTSVTDTGWFKNIKNGA